MPSPPRPPAGRAGPPPRDRCASVPPRLRDVRALLPRGPFRLSYLAVNLAVNLPCDARESPRSNASVTTRLQSAPRGRSVGVAKTPSNRPPRYTVQSQSAGNVARATKRPVSPQASQMGDV